jgi:molybdate/tungstate transport system substrate-binding protein
MVIAHTERSARSDLFDTGNLIEKLLDPDIRFARSDPDSDPCGYRTLMLFQLAEMYYARPGLSASLQKKDKRYIRPKEVDLIALLQVGEVDYIFIYRSVALQHNLKFFELPDEINLKNPGLSDLYSKVSVKIAGQQPGDSVLIKGEPMIYSITIIKGAPNRALAEDFLEFLSQPSKGMKIMEEMGQRSIIPSKSSYYSEIPGRFRKYVTK